MRQRNVIRFEWFGNVLIQFFSTRLESDLHVQLYPVAFQNGKYRCEVIVGFGPST